MTLDFFRKYTVSFFESGFSVVSRGHKTQINTAENIVRIRKRI